jgi:protease PrsW
MLRLANRLFIALLVLAALAGILLSMAALFIGPLLEPEDDFGLGHMQKMDSFQITGFTGFGETAAPGDSPHEVNVTLRTPPLAESDLLTLGIYVSGKSLGEADCFGDYEEKAEYAGLEGLNCTAYLPYDYEPGASYSIVAVLTRGGTEYGAGPVDVGVDWTGYEGHFLGFSWFMGLMVLIIYLAVLLPVGLFVIYTAMRTNHNGAESGEYSWKTLVSPFTFGKTLIQKFHALLVSPYFWAFEAAGILVILLYMCLAAEMWKSATAFIAFIFSGLMAFSVPFLWCAAWWYADYREREPLRIIVTLFLYGMLAALMAIGLNTFADAALAVFGLGFLGSFLIAPAVEELFKGSGLCLVSEHHEYDSVEDGIVFGFTIGMGFSFIENWIYFIGNPMGSNVVSWFVLFLMRSVFFSANHGFYTAITGAVIGYAIERKFRAPALALLVGAPIAALFHAMHNSGELLGAILGSGGTLIYCCLFIPAFDYGGFLILVLLFIRSVLRKKAS